jgi:hypothetical protein
MTPTTIVILVLTCIKYGLISPLQVTCEPIVEWQGGPLVYRTTLKNVSRVEVTLRYKEDRPELTSIRSLEGPPPGFRDSTILPRGVIAWVNETPIQTIHKALGPGESMSETRPLHWSQAIPALKFPTRLAVVWHLEYRLEPAGEPKDRKWLKAEILERFVARPVTPTAAEIEEFINTHPPIGWMGGTDKVEFLPALAERVNERDDVIGAMYSITARAKLATDTVPKRLLFGPDVRWRAFLLFDRWREKELPGSPLPSKELIAELSRAPNEWVRLLTWLTFPDSVREEPTALKKVSELMLPPPSPAVAALVKQLDDPAFKVREEASKRLVRLADEVDDLAPMLRHVLSRPGTDEQLQRLKQVLASLPKRPTIAEHVLSVLDSYETPRATQLLEAIAAGPDALPATQEARFTLKGRKERQRRAAEEKDR